VANAGLPAGIAGSRKPGREKGWSMKFSLNTYTGYSIGAAVVWAVILAFVQLEASSHKKQVFVLVFLGWAIGWVSATIARAVYPPPKSRRDSPSS
jgi:hypothetical protein